MVGKVLTAKMKGTPGPYIPLFYQLRGIQCSEFSSKGCKVVFIHFICCLSTVIMYALHSSNAECINAATIGSLILFDSVRALTKPTPRKEASEPSCQTYRKEYRGTVVTIIIY